MYNSDMPAIDCPLSSILFVTLPFIIPIPLAIIQSVDPMGSIAIMMSGMIMIMIQV